MFGGREMLDPLDIVGPVQIAGILRPGDRHAQIGATPRGFDQQLLERRLAIGAVGAEISQVPALWRGKRAIGLGIDRAIERACRFGAVHCLDLP
jgi:hypothetical protein